MAKKNRIILDQIYTFRFHAFQEAYLQLFEKFENEKIAGESSVFYLVSQNAAKEIKEFNPKSKVINRDLSSWINNRIN